jgi:hypothetical protein
MIMLIMDLHALMRNVFFHVLHQNIQWNHDDNHQSVFNNSKNY